MAPTNRLIEARRTELRAEQAQAEKRRDAKASPRAAERKPPSTGIKKREKART